MHARVTRVRISEPPISDERLQEATALMEVVSRMSGHLGAIWLIDRKTGEGMSIDIYAQPEDLLDTSQGDLRDELIQILDGELVGVEEYEVAGLDRVFAVPPPI